jgi:UDP-N-acetylglucosamine 1-carboxyvinyltransferase
LAKFIIQGGKKLKGEISVLGAKNAALPIIAATLLTDKECEIINVPQIGDVEVMLQILEKLGAEIKFKNHTLKICTKNVKSWKPDLKLVGKMRASILLTGPLLARFGKAVVHYPGGCLIGARPLDTHIDALKDLGAKVKVRKKNYTIELPKPKNKKIILSEMSVTATENILMACAMSLYTNEIHLAAIEPEIEDLIGFLQKLGVKIKGSRTHNLLITGARKLNGTCHKIIPDRIEIATFIILSAVTKSCLKIKNVNLDHLEGFLNKIKEAGVNLKKGKDYLIIKPSNSFKSLSIRTDIYPGFATDFQAPMSVLLTQAEGKSTIFETLFENRFGYIRELRKMGAQIKALNPHQVEIYGPSKLSGAKIISLDLRAGATLILAALCAQGISEIKNIKIIDRGYETLDKRLAKLGADIRRADN